MEYEQFNYVKCSRGQEWGGVKFCLTKPVPCSEDFFIEALWMPIRKQIGKKLIFLFAPKSKKECSLWYNQLAAKVDPNLSTEEQIEFYKKDSRDVIDKALNHIEHIMQCLYGDISDPNIAKFIDINDPIKSVIDNSIIMNGRIPMQEKYFIDKYWYPIKKKYETMNEGVKFKAVFSEKATKLTVVAECCYYNARLKRSGKPECDSNSVMSLEIALIINDLCDAVLEATEEYANALKYS